MVNKKFSAAKPIYAAKFYSSLCIAYIECGKFTTQARGHEVLKDYFEKNEKEIILHYLRNCHTFGCSEGNHRVQIVLITVYTKW
jgi:hypothetical protein